MSAVARWIWEGRAPAARLLRLSLSPAAVGFRAAAALRASAYRAGLLPRTRLARPTIAVGNLAVGGAGKTPVSSWIAAFYAARRIRPAILLRGYGGDEAEVHQRAVPQAIVIENPDRASAARDAVRRGAEVIVLDDAYQRLDVLRDLDIVLVAAESLEGSLRTLPSGPWREAWAALGRAGLAVITRKRARPEAAEAAASWVRGWMRPGRPVAQAELRIAGFRGLWSGVAYGTATVFGARVLACAGVADPRSFAAQLEGLGARVVLEERPDHYVYRPADAGLLFRESRPMDRLVVTEKDAVKLRLVWPRREPEPLVAVLEVAWDAGREGVVEALERAIRLRGSRVEP